MLDIYAGQSAKKIIQEQGINADIFSTYLGASGGPKWFCLFELDKYIFSHFFNNRTKDLNLVGSSAGAFRAACLAQRDPAAAITRMAEAYSESCFSSKAKASEVTTKAKEIVDYILGENGLFEIINNPTFKVHFLINKANGLAGSEYKILQLFGLMKSVSLNRIDRKFISKQYERFVFRPSSSQVMVEDYCGFHTHYVDLTEQNFKKALLASGSIPLVMEGIKDIQGAPSGTYRDGGIIDYHFDIKFKNSNGLTLYPHFNSAPKAGWFDKNLKRKVKIENYDNVLMLVPSKKFVDLLPYSKIPDRKDFGKIPDKERVRYWKKVLDETKRLSDEFEEFCVKQDYQQIKTIMP